MGKIKFLLRNHSAISILLIIFSLVSCQKDTTLPIEKNQSVTIFYTNDEHGWMKPFDELAGGASGLLGRWKENEGYDGSDEFLVLSGGDMWTGPALSSWFYGESMVEVMNAIGYDAAALGNHEFDYSLDQLVENVSKMDFPVLSANIREKDSGNIPDFAQPYVIIPSESIEIGIIGLSSQSTPNSAFPAHVEEFEFLDYAETIDTYAPILQENGVEIIMIIGHICEQEMLDLLPIAKKYNITLIGGGHCHQIVNREIDGIALIQSASYLAAYAKVELEYDHDSKKTVVLNNQLVINEKGYSDPSLDAIINQWRERTDDALAVKIGYCSETIGQNSVAMGNMVVDSWFYTFPQADVSITNSGSIRQDIAPGNITAETIVGLLPFNNTLYELDLTGAELMDCIGNYLMGGMTTVGGVTLSDGTPIYADSVYSVLTTDYLYSISSNHMSTYDPEPYYTSVHYRQPLIDWLKSLNTDQESPLNNYLDPIPRR